jgi:hypothetical protein
MITIESRLAAVERHLGFHRVVIVGLFVTLLVRVCFYSY